MTKRKDGLWQESITVKEKGKKKVKYFYGRTKAEVKKKMLAYQGQLEHGRLFSAVADDWDTEHRETVSYNGHQMYKSAYAMALERFGDTPVQDITPTDINVYIQQIASKGYALRTVKAHISLLNLIFNYAILNGECLSNPAETVRPPRGLKSTPRTLPDDANIAIIENAVSHPFGLFPFLLLYTGCRRGEALALTYEDIDFKNKTISVNKSVYFESNTPVIKHPKTAAGERTIMLLDHLAEHLNPKSKGYVFCMPDGSLLTQTAFRRRWDRYVKDTGITTTPHQLRHLFATILYEAQIDEKSTQEIMGHSSITVTRNIYTHIRRKKFDAVSDALNQYLDGAPAQTRNANL